MKTLREISETEWRFLEICRAAKFWEIRIVVMDGEPKKGVTPTGQQIRFDLPGKISLLVVGDLTKDGK